MVTNGLGKVLSRDVQLEPGHLISGTECEIDFSIPQLPAAEQYTAEVSNRGKLNYSAQELEAADWHVELKLAN